MLNELSKYDNLGTPNYHFELLSALGNAPDVHWTINDIRALFYNRIIDGRMFFDGGLHLLKHLGIVHVNADGKFVADTAFLNHMQSKHAMEKKLVERLFSTLKDSSKFHEIFSSSFISFDIIYRTIQIQNTAFSLKFSGFKQLLLDFSVLKEHPMKELNKYIINSYYKKLFDKLVLPEIKKRKVGVEELKKSLTKKQVYGEEAEKFVLAFEKKRLKGNKAIDWVAEYSAHDGYDIASYESETSDEHDRFIEVKSYAVNPYFFWSKNEMEIARIRKSNYYIYLVNRDKMKDADYEPMMIQNPYKHIYNNELQWSKTIEKIKFEAKLFMEINSTQSNAKSDLKHKIKLILHPFSSEAIGQAIIHRLNMDGPFENWFEKHFYEKGKVKTSSIVSFGLKPLVKLSGTDSLYHLWEDKQKAKLLKRDDEELLKEYISFCVGEINNFFSAVKQVLIHSSTWTTDKKVKHKVLSTSALNGLLRCLSTLIEKGKTTDCNGYVNQLKGLDNFEFSSYKSSHWKAMSSELYSQFFEN